MQAEIYANGPISCSIYAETPAFDNYSGGIMADPHHYNDTTHVVVVTGWGVTKDASKTPYWSVRNSYGTRWGEGPGGGYFRVYRGNNTLGMEGEPCNYVVPSPETVQQLLESQE